MNGFRAWALAVSAALVLFLSGPAAAAPKFPPLTGRVVDNANILSPSTKAALTEKLAALEDQTTRQLVVVTLPSLDGYDIADYGYQLGRHWGIGQKGKDNGVLFIIAPNERAVRIEVGYGLEPILTDALSSVILQTDVIPEFKKGYYEAGIIAGTDALIEQLSLDEPAAKARVAQAEKARSQRPTFNPIFLIFILFFVLSIFGRMFGGRRSGWWILPLILLGGGRGGGFGGGGFGGGGFGGGGGSFGGGGASGRW